MRTASIHREREREVERSTIIVFWLLVRKSRLIFNRFLYRCIVCLDFGWPISFGYLLDTNNQTHTQSKSLKQNNRLAATCVCVCVCVCVKKRPISDLKRPISCSKNANVNWLWFHIRDRHHGGLPAGSNRLQQVMCPLMHVFLQYLCVCVRLPDLLPCTHAFLFILYNVLLAATLFQATFGWRVASKIVATVARLFFTLHGAIDPLFWHSRSD